MSELKFERIGPTQAQELLSGNTRNRLIHDWLVVSMTHSMSHGEWPDKMLDPIIVSKTGKLLNGQHRMWAIISSRTTQTFLVARNQEESQANFIDAGAPRSLGDRLEIIGAVKSCPRKRVSLMRAFFSMPDNVRGSRIWSTQDGVQGLQLIGGIVKWTIDCFAPFPVARTCCAAVMAAVARAKHYGVDPGALSQFVHTIVTGVPSNESREKVVQDIGEDIIRVRDDIVTRGSGGEENKVINYLVTTHAIVRSINQTPRRSIDRSKKDDFPLSKKMASFFDDGAFKDKKRHLYRDAQKKLLEGKPFDLPSIGEEESDGK